MVSTAAALCVAVLPCPVGFGALPLRKAQPVPPPERVDYTTKPDPHRTAQPVRPRYATPVSPRALGPSHIGVPPAPTDPAALAATLVLHDRTLQASCFRFDGDLVVAYLPGGSTHTASLRDLLAFFPARRPAHRIAQLLPDAEWTLQTTDGARYRGAPVAAPPAVQSLPPGSPNDETFWWSSRRDGLFSCDIQRIAQITHGAPAALHSAPAPDTPYDTLVLRSGDIYTGTVTRTPGGVLMHPATGAAPVSLPWSTVQSIHFPNAPTPKGVALALLTDGSAYPVFGLCHACNPLLQGHTLSLLTPSGRTVRCAAEDLLGLTAADLTALPLPNPASAVVYTDRGRRAAGAEVRRKADNALLVFGPHALTWSFPPGARLVRGVLSLPLGDDLYGQTRVTLWRGSKPFLTTLLSRSRPRVSFETTIDSGEALRLTTGSSTNGVGQTVCEVRAAVLLDAAAPASAQGKQIAVVEDGDG